ncbi:MAG TPA: Coq4 family protein [Myxococcota bacterium]|nr:Coq4 family protein [Myxococcota bacterium]
MTNAHAPFEIPSIPMHVARMRWRRALQALRALLADPDDTAKAIEVNLAIDARDFERRFQRFAASPEGRTLLAERPLLADALSDRAALESMHPESLGRAYLGYLEHNGFRATGLLELQCEVQARWERDEGLPPIDPVRAWYRDRGTLAHDLFHVVTGYGTDDFGEATLLAFSQAQLGGRANALLTAGATLEVARSLGLGWLRYAHQAWRRGRRAVQLIALPWEELLPLRLATVRRIARVGEPEETHATGVIAGRKLAGGGHALG